MKLFLIGGFLGSGKTTAIKEAAEALLQQGRKVGVVTNDQGVDLVDTEYLNSFGIPTAQVTNGCFCCNYDLLVESINTLIYKNQPELIFAESVGSCTDLVATIAKPLYRFMSDLQVVITVFVDASLLCSLVNGSASFLNDDVRYIYKKQIEEADVLIFNKMDLLSPDEVTLVKETISKQHETKTILYQDSLQSADIEHWLHILNNFHISGTRHSLDIDYEIYASGEAMLAWYDAVVTIRSSTNRAYSEALQLTRLIERSIRESGHVIGHLKFLINDNGNFEKISHTTISSRPVGQTDDRRNSTNVELLINARVQASPSTLNQIIETAFTTIESHSRTIVDIHNVSSFQPGYPRPTHRIAN